MTPVPAAGQALIRALGARLELVDGDFDMAREQAAAVAREAGLPVNAAAR